MKSSHSLNKDIIAFWGYIPESIVLKYKEKYAGATWVDLDVNTCAPELSIIPEASCRIIKNILDNAFNLKDRIIEILAPIGHDKCDSALLIAQILKENGFKVYEFEDKNLIKTKPRAIICESAIPLKEKVEMLTRNIVTLEKPNYPYVAPKFGFWGVPPDDLSILELFPNETHVFGWLRGVELGVPSSLEVELYVPENLPIIFFAQTFCAKNQIAKYLADKYSGLYINADGLANASIKAKIEAFIQLR